MKLKTLKDIENLVPLGKDILRVSSSDLKQEAIKRIKKIRKDFKEGMAGQTEDYNFMDFFNITEEDLK